MNFEVYLVLLTYFSVVLSSKHFEVKTDYGVFRGHIIKSRSGKDIIVYQGIPYAQPPVGKLRFKDPVKLEKSNKVYNATNDNIACLQENSAQIISDNNQVEPLLKYRGQEDCLYLNVYTPKEPSKKLLPVLFLIHGGFSSGSASETWLGPRYFIDENRDLIIVSPNYRLNIFGFLCANDETVPGNLGLKDQTMALKWVNENIIEFGGDPNLVTITGISYGGATVGHHLNSKASRGLFHRAISQSGTADCPWARQTSLEARRMASNIIAFLACPFGPTELLGCLQDTSIDTLIDSLDVLKVNKTNLLTNLAPVIEKDSPNAFMTQESIDQGSNIPWLTGITSEEGIAFYQFLGIGNPEYLNLSILKKKYKKYLPIVGYYSSNSEREKMTRKLKEFYFGNEEFSENSVKNFIQLLSDRLINYGHIVSARNHKGKHYMYVFSYRGKNTLAVIRPEGLEEATTHSDDIFYFYNNQFTKAELEGEDLDVSNTLLTMWFNFMKHGNPTPDSKVWLESNGGRRYLNITNTGLVMESDMFKERIQFHDELHGKLSHIKDEL